VKGPIARALARDALHQVLDNLVFRIFAGLILVPIAFTFLLGFREDAIVFAFGVERWSYADLFGFLGGPPGVDPRGQALETLIQIVFDHLGGTIGVLFCVAATAFFVPRMIERGTADVLFAKPISRSTLYVSRFVAGLVFVALLSGVLAAGMYLGLLLVSGHDDPGILFAPLALTYVYGLVHAVSMLCGVLTKSSVASLLLTVVFFVFNATVHWTWARSDETTTPAPRAAERLAGTLGAEPAVPPGEDGNDPGPFLRTMIALHYLLPKTGDADVLARKLRRAVETAAWSDEGTPLRLFELPAGFELDRGALPAAPDPALASVLGEARLALRQRDPELAVTLWKRPARTEEVGSAGKTRLREELTGAAARALAALLPGDVDDRDLDFASNARGERDVSARRLVWDEGERTRVALLFKVDASESDGAFVFTLWIDGPRGWLVTSDAARPTPSDPIRRLDVAFGLEPRETRREDRLAFDADWRHNAFFSIGSSLAFALLVLVLGAWRLERMEL
jgi:ABC-type transport system involved in multi-copper enzyme maturation permease subunit